MGDFIIGNLLLHAFFLRTNTYNHFTVFFLADLCPNGGIPCGFSTQNDSNAPICFSLEQACDGVNDCGDPLAFDEIVPLVEREGAVCRPRSGSGSGSGMGIDFEDCER